VKYCETSFKSLRDRTASLEKSDTAQKSLHGHATSFRPFAWPRSGDAADMDVREKVQRIAESHSKYAWVSLTPVASIRSTLPLSDHAFSDFLRRRVKASLGSWTALPLSRRDHTWKRDLPDLYGTTAVIKSHQESSREQAGGDNKGTTHLLPL
jgi:hypothetical protein